MVISRLLLLLLQDEPAAAASVVVVVVTAAAVGAAGAVTFVFLSFTITRGGGGPETPESLAPLATVGVAVAAVGPELPLVVCPDP